MNLIPRKHRNSFSNMPTDFEDFISRFWDNGNQEFAEHLPEVFRGRGYPAVNVAETESEFHVTVDCPGLKESDISVQAMGNSLVVSGERKWEKEKKGKEYRRVESQYGMFERTIPLPENVRIEADKVEASYKQGVLTIAVPKLEKTPLAKIPVHAG